VRIFVDTVCFFASDLHGHRRRYEALFRRIAEDLPAAVLLGGDLLPGGMHSAGPDDDAQEDFLTGFLVERFAFLRQMLGPRYPRVLVILGNDDGRSVEPLLLEGEEEGLWTYLHARRVSLEGAGVYGYSHVPPTPYLLKDWERYDVSRFTDPGCCSPEEGMRTVETPESEIRFGTIARDLEELVRGADMTRVVMLFHAPPYRTYLDRADLDGQAVDGIPLDPHVGSIAIRRFIEAKQPLLTLHGHVHESARLSGSWQDVLGRTVMLSAAHDGQELALVRFPLERPEEAIRELIAVG
jgi:Icc-related predicted phosphoesterase